MPPEIQTLLAQPEWLIAILAIGTVIGVVIERLRAQMRRRKWRKKNPSHADQPWPRPVDPAPLKRVDAADQLRIVMAADFTPQALLNKSEARLFKELDRIVIGCNPSWQVMAQVSLGEVLCCPDKDAYGCINSKRVDLLLMDGDCQPRHAIEYQGGAHHQGTAAARDAVKKEALRRAGVGYIEIVAGQTTPADLKRLIEKLVDRPGQVIP